jgi:hypothetical protein
MNSQVSERIHKRISFQQWQDRFEKFQIVLTTPRTDAENAVIEQVMAVILQHGLSADHATSLLGRTIQLLVWGKPSAPNTMH